MKKFATAILMFELIAGLLFLGLWESRGQIPTAGGAAAQGGSDGIGDNGSGGIWAGSNGGRDSGNGVSRNEAGSTGDSGNVRAEDVRKIAITFDGDVIIGLSQEISYKEAISMI